MGRTSITSSCIIKDVCTNAAHLIFLQRWEGKGGRDGSDLTDAVTRFSLRSCEVCLLMEHCRARARVCDGCILCCAAKVTMSDNRPLRLIKGPCSAPRHLLAAPSSSSVLTHFPRRCSPPLPHPLYPSPCHYPLQFCLFFLHSVRRVACQHPIITSSLPSRCPAFPHSASGGSQSSSRQSTQTQSHNDPDVRACVSLCGVFSLFNRGKTGTGN